MGNFPAYRGPLPLTHCSYPTCGCTDGELLRWLHEGAVAYTTQVFVLTEHVVAQRGNFCAGYRGGRRLHKPGFVLTQHVVAQIGNFFTGYQGGLPLTQLRCLFLPNTWLHKGGLLCWLPGGQSLQSESDDNSYTGRCGLACHL
jgi:hypothetical protein